MVWHHVAFCNPRAILPKARHFQSYINVIADSRSHRDKIIQTEWSLHPKVFQMICQIWHRAMVGMFANERATPVYFSLIINKKLIFFCNEASI